MVSSLIVLAFVCNLIKKLKGISKNCVARFLFSNSSIIYRDKGGLPQFRFDLIHEKVPGEIRPAAVALMRKIQATIRNIPMRHLGFSLYGEHYSLVGSTAGRIRKVWGMLTK